MKRLKKVAEWPLLMWCLPVCDALLHICYIVQSNERVTCIYHTMKVKGRPWSNTVVVTEVFSCQLEVADIKCIPDKNTHALAECVSSLITQILVHMLIKALDKLRLPMLYMGCHQSESPSIIFLVDQYVLPLLIRKEGSSSAMARWPLNRWGVCMQAVTNNGRIQVKVFKVT